MAKFKYLGTLDNQTAFMEKLKSRLNHGNDCYLSIQNRLSSRFISTKKKKKKKKKSSKYTEL